MLAARPNLQLEEAGGTEIQYLGFNLLDPLLKDVRVRQAIACSIDRGLIIQTLMLNHARPIRCERGDCWMKPDTILAPTVSAFTSR